MPVPRPAVLVVSERQGAALAQIAGATTTPMGVVQRARLVLAMAAGGNNTQVAARYQVQVATPRLWRRRWLGAASRLDALETGGCTDKELRAAVHATLGDAYRAGVPPDLQRCAGDRDPQVGLYPARGFGGADQPVDGARPGGGGHRPGHRAPYLAPFGGAFFKRRPRCSRIARATGSVPRRRIRWPLSGKWLRSAPVTRRPPPWRRPVSTP